MILAVRVIPRASKVLVKHEGNNLKVYLTKPAQDNLANEQLIKVLAEHLKVKIYQVRIIRGHNARNKLVEIDG